MSRDCRGNEPWQQALNLGSFLGSFFGIFHTGLHRFGFVLQFLFFASPPSPDTPVGLPASGGACWPSPPHRFVGRRCLSCRYPAVPSVTGGVPPRVVGRPARLPSLCSHGAPCPDSVCRGESPCPIPIAPLISKNLPIALPISHPDTTVNQRPVQRFQPSNNGEFTPTPRSGRLRPPSCPS